MRFCCFGAQSAASAVSRTNIEMESMGPARARSRAQAKGPGPHSFNIGPGGRASGRLSSKTAKSETWFISNMISRPLRLTFSVWISQTWLDVLSLVSDLARLLHTSIQTHEQSPSTRLQLLGFIAKMAINTVSCPEESKNGCRVVQSSPQSLCDTLGSRFS